MLHHMSTLHCMKADKISNSSEGELASKTQSDGQLLHQIWKSRPDSHQQLLLHQLLYCDSYKSAVTIQIAAIDYCYCLHVLY